MELTYCLTQSCHLDLCGWLSCLQLANTTDHGIHVPARTIVELTYPVKDVTLFTQLVRSQTMNLC